MLIGSKTRTPIPVKSRSQGEAFLHPSDTDSRLMQWRLLHWLLWGPTVGYVAILHYGAFLRK